MKRLTSTLMVGGLALAFVGAAQMPASAAEGHDVYVQNYSDSCELPNRTSQFVLDALGADTPTTYTLSDGTPPTTVVVAPHSVDRSPVFSIPASGASYTVTASTGQSWSFTAAPDCKPVVTEPVVTEPVVVPPVDVPAEPPVAVPPVVVPDPVPAEVTVTNSFLLPDGGTPDNVTWPQAHVIDPTQCGTGWLQVDVWTGTQAEIDAILADGILEQGEDSHVIVDWLFVQQDECPVVVPPVTEPPVVVPPVVEPPVIETPETESPDITPIDEVGNQPAITPIVDVIEDEQPIVAKKLAVTTPVADGSLAYTGTDPLMIGSLIAAGLALIVGTALLVVRRLRSA
jgi:hypothetical protein